MEKIIYTKFSNERDKNFQIKTSIIQDEENNRKVVKEGLTQESKRHINNIYNNFNLLSELYNENSNVVVNECNKYQDILEFKYISGETLEQLINKLILKNEYDKIVENVKKFIKVITNDGILLNKFEVTQEFKSVFGNVDLPNNLNGMKISNIDCIFSNIIINDKFNIIDYEWVFDFLVPINYIVYRALICCSMIHRLNLSEKSYIYKNCGITDEELKAYENMEQIFQNYVLGSYHSTFQMYDSIGKNKYHLNNATNIKNYKLVCYIKDNDMNEYSEDKCIHKNIYNSKINEKICLNNFKNINEIRIDPITSNCILELEYIYTFKLGKRINLPIKYTNCSIKYDKKYLFSTYDPQIYIDNLNLNLEYIFIGYKLHEYDSKNIDEIIEDKIKLQKLDKEINEANIEMYEIKNKLDEIESSKGWKVLQKIKSILGK